MKILVDADACPVKNIIIDVAKEFNIDVIMYIDTSHILFDNYAKVITVDKGKDSVDMKLINNVISGDIIVTQDYGLAAMVLSKKAKAINQNGLIYTNDNIDSLLFQRHIGQKVRASGGKTKNIKKRTTNDDINFEKSLRNLIKNIELP